MDYAGQLVREEGLVVARQMRMPTRHCKAARLTISQGTAQPESAIPLHFALAFAHKERMDNDAGTQNPIRRLLLWAITPPQSYGVYLGGIILVYALSFYAGTLKPKHVPPAPPVTTPSAPHS